MTWINSFADAFDIVRSEVLQFNLEISDEVGLDDESDYIQVEDDLCTVKCKLDNLIRNSLIIWMIFLVHLLIRLSIKAYLTICY